MTLLPSETRASIRTAVARAVGALETTGTTTTAADTVTFTSADLIYADDDALIGLECVMKSGSSLGEARLITDFTAASDTVVVHKSYTALAAGGAETFDIYRPQIADKALLDDAIKDAIERAQDKHMIYWEDLSSLVTGSVLKNGGFEDWLAGTALAPTGWTATGTGLTVGRSTTHLRGSRYSVLLTDDATNECYLEQSTNELIIPWDLLLGHTLTFKVPIYSTSTAVKIGLTDDGTTFTEDTHDGNEWDILTASEEMDSTASEITARITIPAGTDTTIYIAPARLTVAGLDIREYYLPDRFVCLQRIIRESSDEFEFPLEIPQKDWYADKSRERLILPSQPSGYRLKLIGQAYQQVPDDDEDAIYLSQAYIVAAAREYILARIKPGEAEHGMAMSEALRLRRQLHNQPLSNSRRVR